MCVNSLPKTVTRQRRGCDLNSGPSEPKFITLTSGLYRGRCLGTNVRSLWAMQRVIRTTRASRSASRPTRGRGVNLARRNNYCSYYDDSLPESLLPLLLLLLRGTVMNNGCTPVVHLTPASPVSRDRQRSLTKLNFCLTKLRLRAATP